MNNWKLRHSFTGNATSDVQTVNGYLADPAYHLTTNLLLQSNQFDTTWTTNTASVTSGQSGYDGSTDAWSLSVGTSFFSGIYQSLSLNGVSTASIYAKAGTFSFLGIINLSGAGFAGWFDLINGTVGNLDASVIDASMEAVGNGWWRCSFSQDRSGTSYFQLRPSDTNSAPSSTSGNIYIQDAQLEEGTQATTYVETTTDPVTLPDTFNVTVVPDGKEYAAPLFIPRTNILLQSNQFDTTWTLDASMTLTSGQSGYDGSSDAWLLDKTAIQFRAVRQIPVHSNVVTFSVYAKQGTLRYLNYYSPAGDAPQIWFDLQAGAIGTTLGVYIEAKMESVGGGWYRCSVTYDAASGDEVRIYPQNLDGSYGSVAGNIYIQDAQLEAESVATEYIPTTTAAVTRDWSAFGRVQNQLPGISNGTHTHTGAASGSGIAATTITGSGSGATFAYDFDTLGVLTTLTADGAGSGYKVGDKLSIDTTEGHTIEFRLVEGSNAATVSVSMGAAKPNKPIPFPVSKMRVEGLTDRTVLFMDERSRYVFPKPTPYLLDTYEGAAAAYSLRRLRSSYTGPAVRVRRQSNNDELDIYFNRDGSLDTATLEAFCAGTDGFVKVWFDQGQGGNDATQTTTASQPQIVASGSVVTENGKPCIRRASTSSNMTFAVAGNSTQHIFGVVNISADKSILTSDVSTSANFYLAAENGAGTSVYGNATGGDFYLDGTLSNATIASRNALHDALLDTQRLFSQKINNSTWGANQYFGYSASSVYAMMDLQEVILYNSDQSANRAGIEDNINEHYGIYEFSGLLDDYSGAAAAYSLRRLSSTYTGPAIRVVKHDVGYPEMDIPFEDDGTLSVVLLEAFADGYDATVKVWYDQSGGSNDAEQSTLASQPKIVNAGTVIYENGLPAVQFDGTTAGQGLFGSNIGSVPSAFSCIAVRNRTKTVATDNYLFDSDSGSGRAVFDLTSVAMRLTNYFTPPFGGTGQTLIAGYSSTTASSGYTNGVDIGISGTHVDQDLSGAFAIGNFYGASSQTGFGGTIQEIILYQSDQSANRTGIETNVNDFYSIYP